MTVAWHFRCNVSSLIFSNIKAVSIFSLTFADYLQFRQTITRSRMLFTVKEVSILPLTASTSSTLSLVHFAVYVSPYCISPLMFVVC